MTQIEQIFTDKMVDYSFYPFNPCHLYSIFIHNRVCQNY